jgi:rfaE bifunctional protein kinase chain/domain
MKKAIIERISSFLGKKILVWGDIILDEYIYTSSSRISREAPVLITEFESDRFLLGGAGNVLLNIKKLGAVPVPVGLIGKDPTGVKVTAILEEKGIETSGLIKLNNFDTPRKTRIMSGGEHTKKQQVLRVDRINKRPVKKKEYDLMEKVLIDSIPDFDLLLISDYIYQSVNTDLYRRIRQEFPDKLFLVDSRENFNRFDSASYFIPNEPEMRRLFYNRKINDDQDFINAGKELIKKLHLSGLVLKRGQEGMLVLNRVGNTQKIEVYGGKDIVDVTGAGDTVISVISLGLLSGLSIFDSAWLANVAAGLVVMKEGAYPISDLELKDELKKIL